MVVWRTAKRIHRNAQLGVEFPGIQRINAVLHSCLPVHQLLHFFWIIEDLFLHEFHVDLLVFFEDVDNFLCALLDDLAHSLGLVQIWLLRKVPHGISVGPHHLALVGLVEAGNDFHHGGLSSAVVSDDANFGPIEKRQVNVFEDVLAGGGRFVDPHHAEDDFLVVRHGEWSCNEKIKAEGQDKVRRWPLLEPRSGQ